MDSSAKVGIDSTKHKFVVGFTVHEAKELSRDGQAIDPLVVVRCLGHEYKTELKRGKLQHAKWEESYIWSDVWLTESQFNMSFIDFELQAANIFFRNDVVGEGRIQLAMVKKRKNHTYARKTLQLVNAAQLTAKLTVTVFCYGEGDEPPVPEDMEQDDEEVAAHLQDLGAAVLGDGHGKKQFTQCYHLFVQVHRAEHLGGGDQVFNPYVTAEFNGHKLSTPPAKEAHTITFDECFRMPVTTPLFADSIVIRVWDAVKWGTDEIIVQGRLSFSLLRTHALQPKWFNFYGFSKEEVKDINQLTGQGEKVEENYYQGRLLISGRVQKVAKLEDLLRPAAIKGQTKEEPPAAIMHFLADVYKVSGCAGSEVYVELSIGRKNKKTKNGKRTSDSSPDSSETGQFIFKEGKGRMAPLAALIPTDPSNQLDMIISVYSRTDGVLDGGFRRVGFVRQKLSEIKDWKGEASTPVWIAMHPMAHLPSSVEPGAILISLAKSMETVATRGVPDVRALPFKLRCYVCAARGLMSSEPGRVPNTYCQITCAGETGRTLTVPFSSAPTWGQRIDLSIHLQCALQSLKVYPEPIQVIIYDEVGGEDIGQKLQRSAQNLQKMAASDFNNLGSAIVKESLLGVDTTTRGQDRKSVV